MKLEGWFDAGHNSESCHNEIVAVVAAEYGDLVVSKGLGIRVREQMQAWTSRVYPVDEVVAVPVVYSGPGIEGDAEDDKVDILGDDFRRQGDIGGFDTRAVDEEVGEHWRAGGAEGHGDGQAGARLRPGGGGVAAGGAAGSMADEEAGWNIVAGPGRHGLPRSINPRTIQLGRAGASLGSAGGRIGDH